jgi:nucleotide-binding universal stress UspA family protein
MLPRFKRLLRSTSRQRTKPLSIDIALEIASENGGRVTLLHVIETIENVPPDELKGFYEQLTSRASTQLEARCLRFADARINIDWKLRSGKRLVEIVQDARDRQTDLIVMSSHRVDPATGPQSFGTLSYQVSVLCDCPVLLLE